MDALTSNREVPGEQGTGWGPNSDERAGQAPLATDASDPVALLDARRQELQEQLAALAGDDNEAAHPRFSNHLAEDAQDQQQFQGEVARRHILLSELRQVEHALTRAASGQYGVCEDCGREIPPRRLQIIPAATLCVACQARRETQRTGH
jgi:DnaK suppressor protein